MKKSIPWLISLMLSIWVISKMIPHRQASGLDIDGFSRLPVSGGRRPGNANGYISPYIAFGDESPRNLHR